MPSATADPAEVFREHARLSAYRNNGARLFDIGDLAAIGNSAYETLEPQRWGGIAVRRRNASPPPMAVRGW